MFSDEEPPRKKRRSKWDITPSEPSTSVGNQEATVSSQLAPAPSASEPASNVPSSAIAAAAAAKINAMLASQGKLAKSDPPLAKVSTFHMTVLMVVVVSDTLHNMLAVDEEGCSLAVCLTCMDTFKLIEENIRNCEIIVLQHNFIAAS